MFAEFIDKSNIIELVEGAPDEEGNAYRATLRVLPGKQKAWLSLLKKMLKLSAEDQEEFGFEPHKAYYWDSDSKGMRFSWVLLVWGDLDSAKVALGALLATQAGTPPPPKTADPRMRPSAARGSRRRVREVLTDDGSLITVTQIPIPHVPKDRLRYTSDASVRVGLESSRNRFNAAVRSRGEDEFAPSREAKI